MEDKDLKFSVVLCTYNGEKFVKEQIDSIINQSYPVNEIIISDDGSKDETLQVVRDALTYFNGESQILINTGKHGVANNFLNGLRAASGDYIFTCDQDDIWKTDKIEIFRNHILKTAKLLYFSNGEIVDAEGKDKGYNLWDTLSFSVKLLRKRKVFDILLNRCIVTGAAMAVSKELVDDTTKIPECWLHDGWFAMKSAVLDSIEPIDEITFLYRQHGDNVVGATAKGLKDKVRSYFANLSKMKEVREEKYLRYKTVLDLIFENNMPSDKLVQCVKFWESLTEISSKKKWKSLKIIFSQSLKGNYKRYYTGTRGAFRDFLSVFRKEQKIS